MNHQENLSSIFKQNLENLADAFSKEINDYFFTEKDICCYFYFLTKKFAIFNHRGYCLLHTEYPTPFKCSYLEDKPYIKLEPDDSGKQRSHIDTVLINPLFIDWLIDSNKNIKSLSGLGEERFDSYIKKFYDIYTEFNEKTGESILLYAVEFKFLRHSYVGHKYPIKEIRKDIAKLCLLRQFSEKLQHKIDFVRRTKAVIFIGERNQRAGESITIELKDYDQNEYMIITRRT